MEERNYKLYLHITPNGKRYYGITGQERVEDRWQNGIGYSTQYFYRAINKYGWDNIQHEVIFNNLTKEEACLLEQCYIALYNTMNPKYGYNSTTGGEHCELSEEHKKKISEAHKGKKHSEESKKKISEKSKGRKHSEESKKKIGQAHKGKQHSEESKKKNSEAHKGRKHSEESKKKIGEANKGENHPMYGKKFSEEHNKKISESRKGKYTGGDNPNAKKVKCLELNKPFDSVADANVYLGKDRQNTSIRACARGKTKTAWGLHWEYVKEGDTAC